MALVGKVFKFDAFVYYYGIKFILNNHVWNRLNISLIYGAGPFSALILALFAIYFYSKLKKIRSMLNLFFMWCFVIGTSMFCAQGIIASLGTAGYNSPYYQGFSVVFAWIRVPVPVIYLLNIPFAVLMLYFAVNIAKPFLAFAYSYTKVNKVTRRRKFFFESVMVPFVVGAFVTTLIVFPMPHMFIHLIYLLVIAAMLIIAWLSLFYIEILKDEVLKYKKLQTPNAIFFFVLVILIILLRYVTWTGIYLSFN